MALIDDIFKNKNPYQVIKPPSLNKSYPAQPQKSVIPQYVNPTTLDTKTQPKISQGYQYGGAKDFFNDVVVKSVKDFLSGVRKVDETLMGKANQDPGEALKLGMVPIPTGKDATGKNKYFIVGAGPGELEDISKNIFKNIAKEVNPQKISGLLKKLGIVEKDVIDELSNKLSPIKKATEVENIVKPFLTPEAAEIERVSNNLLKNNSGITKTDAEAMARDVIANREFNKNIIPPGAKSEAIFKKIIPAENLSPEYKAIETAASEKVRTQGAQILEDYKALEKTKNGKIVNLDNFRPFFEEEGYKGFNSAAVQEPSSALGKQAFTDALKNPEPFATFTSGGSGAGKSSALEGIASYKQIEKNSAVVFDSNLSKLDSAIKKLDEATKAGKQTVIYYVYREPTDALEKGIIYRMKNNVEEGGRIVPNSVSSENTVGAWEVAKELHKKGVKVRFVDNSLGQGAAKEISFEQMAKKADNLPSSSELKKVFDNKVKELADNGGLTPEEYKAYIGDMGGGGNEVVKPTAKGFNIEKQKPRQFAESVIKSDKTPQQVKESVKSFYTPITNKELVKEANTAIKKDINEAVRVAKAPGPATARSNVYAQQLIHEYSKAGRYEDAIEMVEITAKRATSQGQAIQALSLYNKLTPEGILRYAESIVEKANVGLKNKIKLDKDFAKALVERAKKIEAMPEGREKVVETAKMLQTIYAKVPTPLLKKISTIQTFAQLLNPKTAIRNIIGNTGFAVLENIKDIPAVALDSAMSFVSGKRTKALPDLATQFKGLKSGFLMGVEDALNRIDTAKIPTQFDLPNAPVFKGGIGKKLEQLLNLELRAPDRAFYKSAYDGSLFEQLKAAKTTVVTDEMKLVAHQDALYRTFQDDNVVSKVFVGIKKALNVGQAFGVGDIVLKYPKTPANLLARGIEYSPGGFVNTLYEATKPLIGKVLNKDLPFNQRAFVESFSRALVGTTGLVGTGALLHRLGIITGKPEKDKDIKGIQRLTGLGQYRINVSALTRFVFSGFDPSTTALQDNDRLVSYDWLQPMAIGVAMGANIDEGSGAYGQSVDLLSSLNDSIDTLAEQPLVTGLTRALKYGSLSSAITETMKGVPSSFTPTILSQINQLLDNKQRSTYSPSTTQYALNLAKAKVPGLAQTLPVSVDALGEDLERYQGAGNNIFNVLFNPAFTSKYKKTPEAQMVLDLMNETGETRQAPRLLSYTQQINGESKKLTPTQVQALQRYVGTVTKNLFASFVNDENFQALPPTDKVSYIANVLSDIGSAGKIVILGNRPAKPSKRTLEIIRIYNGKINNDMEGVSD